MAIRLTYYVDGAAGSDNNSGSSEGSPKANGTNAATIVGATVTLLVDAPDLSTVVANQDTIRLNGRTDGRQGESVFAITAVDDTLKTVTVSPSPNSITSGVTWQIGGAFATISRGLAVMLAGNGDYLYVKDSATYNEAAHPDHVLGANLTWSLIKGYHSIPSDSGVVTLDSSGTKARGIQLTIGSTIQCVVSNFKIKNYTAVGIECADAVHVQNCEVDTCVAGITGTDAMQIDACYVHNCTSKGIAIGGTTPTFVHNCVVITCGTNGIAINNGAVVGCLVKDCVDDGIKFTSGSSTVLEVALNNTVDGNGKNTTNGINFLGALVTCVNNLVTDCDVGIKGPTNGTDIQIYSSNNLVFGNTAPYSSFATSWNEFTTDPLFVNKAINDYTPGTTSDAAYNGFDLITNMYVPLTGIPTHIGAVGPKTAPSTAVAGADINLPAAGEVKSGIGYGTPSDVRTGTRTVPAESNVISGGQYGADGTEFTGTYPFPINPATAQGVYTVANAVGSSNDNSGTGPGVDPDFLGANAVHAGGGVIDLSADDPGLDANVIGTHSSISLIGRTDGRGGTGIFKIHDMDVINSTVTVTPVPGMFTGGSWIIGGAFATVAYANAAMTGGHGDTASVFTDAFGQAGSPAPVVLLPDEGDVHTGVQYGIDQTEFTGTRTDAAIGDVQAGVQYGAGGVALTGTFAVPAEAQVESGIGFGADGTEFTGTLGDSCDYPTVGDVEKGVAFANGTKTGTFKVPAQTVVLNAEQYGSGDTEFTGSFMATTGGEAPEPFLEL